LELARMGTPVSFFVAPWPPANIDGGMRSKVQRQFVVIGLVIIVMGGVLVALGLHADRKEKELAARGVSEPARILSGYVELPTKGTNKRYILTVQWGEPQGTQSQKFAVEKDYFDSKIDGANNLISAATTVRHIPGEPDTALMEGASYAFAGWQSAGYVVTFLGALMLVFGLRKAKS
jgi:hypothetical protein